MPQKRNLLGIPESQPNNNMTEENDNKVSLAELDKKIKSLKPEIQETENTDTSDGSKAMRLGVEFASGIIVGAFLGYWLDKWLGSFPMFFIIFFFLGVAAGSFNIYKLATQNDQGNGPDKQETDKQK